LSNTTLRERRRTSAWTYTLCSPGSSIAYYPVASYVQYQFHSFLANTIALLYRHRQLLFIHTLNTRIVTTQLTKVSDTRADHLLFCAILLDCGPFAFSSVYSSASFTKKEKPQKGDVADAESKGLGCMFATDV
jgi:hypothetical protein